MKHHHIAPGERDAAVVRGGQPAQAQRSERSQRRQAAHRGRAHVRVCGWAVGQPFLPTRFVETKPDQTVGCTGVFNKAVGA